MNTEAALLLDFCCWMFAPVSNRVDTHGMSLAEWRSLIKEKKVPSGRGWRPAQARLKIRAWYRMVGVTGIEPVTPTMSM